MNKFILTLTSVVFILFSACTQEKPVETMAAEAPPVKEWAPDETRNIPGLDAKRGLVVKTAEATPGYVLFHSGGGTGTSTYLMNLDGEIVHVWQGKESTLHSYLKDDGGIFRLEVDPDFPVFAGGGQAGIIREYGWDGDLEWTFRYVSDQYLTHHDFAVMPNGNILAISWEAKTREQAIEAGRNPELTPKAGIWPDKIIEVEPQSPEGGKVVWEWHMWDHLVQDFDETKQNYGNISEHPRKIDLNAHAHVDHMTEEQVAMMKKQGNMTSNATPDNLGSDWAHVNSIVYNADLDQIAVSSQSFGEIWIIDHSTTAEEAKGSTGGRWGHGGDLLYRWGNPATYGSGGPEDQRLFGQHDVKWIEEGKPGAGNLIVFNNDVMSPESKFPNAFAAMGARETINIAIGDLSNYSSVLEIEPTVDENGAYILEEGGSFGPDEPSWMYTAPDKYSFYAPFVSGVHRMENGNTFITSGPRGRMMEVTPSGKVVWEYWNPYFQDVRKEDGTRPQPVGPFVYALFRGTHIPDDHPALAGKTLEPVDPQPEIYIPPPPPSQDPE